ncbi:MAG: mechanosensitive ion channel family protein [Tissierellia bacterium]|nr:mechanosensitive ion channel family protein [Tissierellia bacterium]
MEEFMTQLRNEAGDWNIWGRVLLALLVLVLMKVLTRFVTYLMGRRFKDFKYAAKMEPGRALTINQLLQKLINVSIYFIGILLILNMFKVDTSTILATAGIGSLAIGMGAQTLIKDLINGFFIVLEDQYSVGDLVEAAGVTGHVEDLGVRVTKLRGFDGSLHIIPNSEIRIVRNMERGPMRARVDFYLDQEEDPAQVIEVIEEAIAPLREDPLLSRGLSCWGVSDIVENGYIITVVAFAEPGNQYNLAYKLAQRLVEAIQQAGFAMPKFRVVGGNGS